MNLPREFWEKVYVENAAKIKGICRRYVSDMQIAEDLMHDVFLTAINRERTFRGKGHFNAWLSKIAVNTALMYLRKRNILGSRSDHISVEKNNLETENTDMKNKRAVIEYADFSTTELLEVIDQLPEHHKCVFNLYVLDNYTHVQIAKELNISQGTSKSHLARARKKVQELLYQRAVEHKKEKYWRKRAGLFLFVLSGKRNYIDKIYRDRFRSFRIEIYKKTNTIFDSLNWKEIRLPIIKTYAVNFWSYLGFISIAGGVIISSIIILNPAKSNQEVLPKDVKQPNSREITDTSIIKKDTVVIKEKKIPHVKSNPPVVIKRKVIKRKTVIIKDTLKIEDSIHVH